MHHQDVLVWTYLPGAWVPGSGQAFRLRTGGGCPGYFRGQEPPIMPHLIKYLMDISFVAK